MSLPPVNIDMIVCEGGLNQISPTLSTPAGIVRQALNFEAAVTGGYTRIKGYERFDGHASPSVTADAGTHHLVSVASYTDTPTVGQTLTTSGGATGVLAWLSGTTMALTSVTGTLTAGDTIAEGVTPIGTLSSVTVVPASAEQIAIIRNAVADIHRAAIAAVPGSGPVRGIVGLNNILFAFRDNVGGSAVDIYKSTAAGWSKISMYYTVSFTAGGAAEPAEGATLTQGGVAATIKRVVRNSGSWAASSAAGQLIIAAPAGGNLAAGAATIGATSVTLSGAQAQIVLPAGGSYEFDVYNFSGQSGTTRIYGANGVGTAFEFDGSILAPIKTGAATDTPDHVVAHKGYLFLGIKGSLMHSAPGLPYDFTAVSGAAEIATGDDLTGMIVMPGGTGQATLGVMARTNTYILYGSSPDDWNLVAYNTGTGSVPRTQQNMASTYVFDDRGLNALQATISYGNFSQTSLTAQILPWINERIGKAVCATLCRQKSQYRVFFNDGYGLFVTVVNGKLLGCMPVYFPDTVNCCFEGKNSSGADVIYFGSTTGMVYQMEKGTSFDGAPIPYSLTYNRSFSKQPRTLKRYRKIVPEVTADSSAFALFDLGYQLGGNSPEYSQDVPLNYDQTTGGARWDSGITWDSFYWDASAISPLECYCEGTAENIAIVINGNSDYVSAFTLNSFLIHYSPRRLMR